MKNDNTFGKIEAFVIQMMFISIGLAVITLSFKLNANLENINGIKLALRFAGVIFVMIGSLAFIHTHTKNK